MTHLIIAFEVKEVSQFISQNESNIVNLLMKT